jgi:hypothetical protein
MILLMEPYSKRGMSVGRFALCTQQSLNELSEFNQKPCARYRGWLQQKDIKKKWGDYESPACTRPSTELAWDCTFYG